VWGGTGRASLKTQCAAVMTTVGEINVPLQANVSPGVVISM
jgi:hypothetical protein